MLKNLTKLILTAKAAVDVMKDKLESKACDLAMQMRNFAEKGEEKVEDKHEKSEKQEKQEKQNGDLKEKAKEELFKLISEISHKTQINELQFKGLIKDKLVELTNNALLDSQELNDIRAEIASLKAELQDVRRELRSKKTV